MRTGQRFVGGGERGVSVNSGDLFWIKVVFAVAVAAIGLAGTYLPWILGRRGPSERGWR